MKNFKNLVFFKWILLFQLLFVTHYSWAINSLTIALNPWFNSINPPPISLEAAFIANQVFEPLMRVKPDGSIAGCLIKSWSVSADYKTFYFKLNPNIYFSDGTLLTTSHIQNMFNKETEYSMFASLKRILGTQSYLQKKVKTIVGFKIINNQEFIIKLTLPFPNLILQLAASNISVFLQENNSDNFIGTGPYRIEKFDKKNETLILKRNLFYKRKTLYYDQIVFNHKQSANTDISESLPERPILNQFNSKEYFISQVYFLGFNANNKNLSNLQTRKYLACLLPQQELNYEHNSFIPMGIFGYNSSLSFNCNITNPPKNNFSKNYIVTYYLDYFTNIAQSYCNVLKSHLIQCKIHKVDSAEELQNLKKNGNLEIFLARFKSQVPLADDLFLTFMKSHPVNFFDNGNTGFSTTFEKTFEKLYQIPPTSKNDLMNIYTRLNELIINNYMARPISYGTAEKLWVKKNISIPDMGIMGITGLDLTEVKPL